MRILVACEFSGVVRDAFRKRGHDAWSCDILPTEADPLWHLTGDVRRFLDCAPDDEPWDLMVAHPPCTYLNRAGWHWVNKPDCAVPPLKGEPRLAAMMESAEFFRVLLDAPIERIAIENPIPISHAGLPPFTQIIQPHNFGHPEFKATCLWLKNLPNLIHTNQLEIPGRGTPEHKAWSRIHRMPPGPDRWRERSRTFQGIADAMADQWGSL